MPDVERDEQREWHWLSALECVECGRRWLNGNKRWRAYLTDDEPAEVMIYCPECAHREFDWP